MKEVIMSAYATDATNKAFCLYFGRGEKEFLPKSQVFLEEAPRGISRDTPEVCFFRVPIWLVRRLRGVQFYDFL